jgi:DNA-binding IclR family transcriptional regulator
MARSPVTQSTNAGRRPARMARAQAGRPVKKSARQQPNRPDTAIVTAVDRAARVLAAFSQSWDFLTLAEVATRSGLSKPTAFRILATLMAEGLVFQNAANGTYGLGALNLRLADIILGSIDIRERARAAMRQVRTQINETVVLSIRDCDACYHVDSFESTQSISHSQPVGVPFPLHTVVAGRAMLAAASESDVDGYLKRLAPATRGANARRLLLDIETIRRQGYAVSAGEASGGGHTVAVAVPNGEGASAAALHISFPQGRFTNSLEQRCIDVLQQAVAYIGHHTQGSKPVVPPPELNPPTP